ncbi:MAG: hypothetical protein J1E62_04595 [Lachnospiraceae bacterium]|nr:hypothetical protein [Lachnospiraceae bacterium]
MREKINQLAEGKFEYQTSGIITTPERLELESAAVQTCQTSIVISNEKGRLMKGIVTTHSPEVSVTPANFRGEENEIQISVQTDRIKAGESYTSSLQIVSDCGICEIPLKINIVYPMPESAGKKIESMKQFVQVAQEDFAEAVRLFDQDAFASGLLAKDREKQFLYQGLSSSKNRFSALEEFLVGIEQKEPIGIAVGQVYKQYEDCTDAIQDEITILKNTWGYEKIHISSDAPFLCVHQETIATTDFEGDSASCKFTLDPDKMVMGKNFARINISTLRQTIKISVTAIKPGVEHERAQRNRREQRTLCRLLEQHLKFSMNRLPMEEYLEEMDRLLESSGLEKNSMRLQLYRIHLAIMGHQVKVIEEGLNALEEQAEVLHRDAPELYAGYYYLKGVWSGEEDVVASCVERIRECYDKQGQNAHVLWYLLYLDPAMQSDKKKYQALMEQLQTGCYSPFLYVEICQLLNDNPDFLTELDEEVVQALHWGCKQQFLEKEIALRYVYLAGRMRYYSAGILEDMTLLYECFPEDEILTAICKNLMKGQVTTRDAFVWYAKGVEHNLKITNLFEYYMYALDEEQELSFTHAILLYFLYDNHLTMEKKAMLYAYIVKEKANDGETYESYRIPMQNFAIKQLREGRINANLAVLYQEFITEEILDEDLAEKLAGIFLRSQLTCHNKNIRGVYVCHPELEAEEFVPLIKGKAMVSCLTERAKIFFVDRDENRYVHGEDYTLTPLLSMEHMADACHRYQTQNRQLLLYLNDKANREPVENHKTMKLRHQILELDGLSETYRHRVEAQLIHYYYHHGEQGLLEEAMEHLDWSHVIPADRGRFIEYCALCGCYEKAMEGVLQFGFAGIPVKRLQTISEKTFRDVSAMPDERMLCLAWELFKEDAYGRDVLEYLMRFYSGKVQDLVRIWQAAEKMELDNRELQERLIAQCVFSGEVCPEIFDVFLKYQDMAENKQVVLAFKKWMAHEYLLRDRQLPDSMFESYFKDVQIRDNVPCLLAVLKYFSGKETLTEEEIKFSDYHVNRLYDKKIILPFYQNFHGKFTLPVHIPDQVYVDYVADPDCEVSIHYRIYSENERGPFREEKMRDVFAGIRVIEFVLFEDEVLEYYMTEHHVSGDVKSDTKRITMDRTPKRLDSSSRYDKLNKMMAAQNAGEDSDLIDMMEQFTMEREIAATIFKPM